MWKNKARLLLLLLILVGVGAIILNAYAFENKSKNANIVGYTCLIGGILAFGATFISISPLTPANNRTTKKLSSGPLFVPFI